MSAANAFFCVVVVVMEHLFACGEPLLQDCH
jgi:hypothetical protein